MTTFAGRGTTVQRLGSVPVTFERRPWDTLPVPTHADEHPVSLDRADGVPCPAAEPVASFDFQACSLERLDGHKIPKMVTRDCYGHAISNLRRARSTASLSAWAQSGAQLSALCVSRTSQLALG